MLRKILVGGLCVAMVIGLVGGSVLADPTMDRIEKTGKIRIGFREGSIPFAYIDEKGQHVGFSVDMAKLFVEKLSEYFDKKIELIPYTVTPKTRIPLVVNGTIDIEMGSSTHTDLREEVADFSIPFFMSETTFMVAKDSGINSLADLTGKIVGSARGTTNLRALQKVVEEGKIKASRVVIVDTHPKGFLALKQGKIDAYFTDTSLLMGLKMKAPNPENWKIVPEPIAYEPYGYIMREGNSDFRDFVNHFIIWTIKTGKFYEIYDKWMGPNGPVPIPMSRDYKAFLKMICWPLRDTWPKK